MGNKRFPNYPYDVDYNTNAPSYYEDLARKEKFMQLLAERIFGYDDKINDHMRELALLIKGYDDKINDIEVSGVNPIHVGEENTENKPLWIDTSDLIKGFVPVPPTDYIPNEYDPPTDPEDPPAEAVVVFDSREEELQFQKTPGNIYLSYFEVFLEPNREYAFYTNFGGSMSGDLWVSNSIYVPKQVSVVDGTATIVSNTNGSFVIIGRVETDPDTGQANEYSVAHFINKTYYFTITEVD